MFKKLEAKFAVGSMVELRHSFNAYVGKEVGRFSRGHTFIVKQFWLSASIVQVKEEASEGNILEPHYIFELEDADGRIISVYGDSLKKVKINLENTDGGSNVPVVSIQKIKPSLDKGGKVVSIR